VPWAHGHCVEIEFSGGENKRPKKRAGLQGKPVRFSEKKKAGDNDEKL
jgi:hypothetical protein